MIDDDASHIEQQKIKLEQKKNRLAAAETILKIKEHKLRTRNLIKAGELIERTKLNILPLDTLYGALLSLSEQLENDKQIVAVWNRKGNATLNNEQQTRVAIILKFDEQPSGKARELVRSYGLRWNSLRKEWGGYVNHIGILKEGLGNIQYNLEIIEQ